MKMSEEEYNEAEALAKEIIEQLIEAKKIGDHHLKKLLWQSFIKNGYASIGISILKKPM